MADWFDRNENDDDHFTQPGNLFRKVMTAQDRKNTLANIVGAMSGISGPKRSEIIKRQLALWTKVDKSLGAGIAARLGVKGGGPKGAKRPPEKKASKPAVRGNSKRRK